MDTKQLHTLIPLSDFKALLGVDDREDALGRFCLITATYSIEHYCRRGLLSKKNFEFHPFYGDYAFPLREYPVGEVLAVYGIRGDWPEPQIIEPDFYQIFPDCGVKEDIPFILSVSPALRLKKKISGLKVHYRAGYRPDAVPPDLGSACLEHAGWNFFRYRERHIGIAPSIKGAGEHLETAMPENVKALLEPYRRHVI